MEGCAPSERHSQKYAEADVEYGCDVRERARDQCEEGGAFFHNPLRSCPTVPSEVAHRDISWELCCGAASLREERRGEIFSTLAELASCWPQAVSRKLRSAAFSDYLAGLVWRCAHVHPTAFSSPPCVLACVCCALSSLCASIFLFALCLVSIVQPRKAKEEPESRTCLCTVLYSLIIVGICGGVVALLMVGGMGR